MKDIRINKKMIRERKSSGWQMSNTKMDARVMLKTTTCFTTTCIYYSSISLYYIEDIKSVTKKSFESKRKEV